MQSEKSKIDVYLESQIKDSGRFLPPEHKFYFKTELINKDKFLEEKLPQQKVFKPSLFNKISATIFGVGGFSTLAILVGVEERSWGVALILFSLAIVILIKLWISAPNNSIKIDRTGLFYNKDFFPWNSIISTHILYLERTSNHGRGDESYLILELQEGKIMNLELTKINFSKIYMDSSSKDEKIFGHYIEMYKKQSN